MTFLSSLCKIETAPRFHHDMDHLRSTVVCRALCFAESCVPICDSCPLLHIVLDSHDVMKTINTQSRLHAHVCAKTLAHCSQSFGWTVLVFDIASLSSCETKVRVRQGAWSEVRVIVPKHACYDWRAKGRANSRISKFNQRFSPRHWAVLPQQGVAKELTHSRKTRLLPK